MTERDVSLILRSELATLAEISAAVGLEPSKGHSRGEVPHGGKRKFFRDPMPHTTWVLDSDESWQATIAEHIRSLTTLVPPDRLQRARAQLPVDLRVEIDVGVFYEGQAGHIEFSPEILDIVRAYGAILVVTSYSVEPEDGESLCETPQER